MWCERGLGIRAEGRGRGGRKQKEEVCLFISLVLRGMCVGLGIRGRRHSRESKEWDGDGNGVQSGEKPQEGRDSRSGGRETRLRQRERLVKPACLSARPGNVREEKEEFGNIAEAEGEERGRLFLREDGIVQVGCNDNNNNGSPRRRTDEFPVTKVVLASLPAAAFSPPRPALREGHGGEEGRGEEIAGKDPRDISALNGIF